MPARNRTRVFGTLGGSSSLFDHNGTLIASNASSYTLRSEESMGDQTSIVKPFPDHDYSHTIQVQEISPLNGRAGPLLSLSDYRDFNDFVNGLFFPLHLSTGVPASSSGDINLVAARTNPSRPSVTPLTLVQDVVDLPKMIRSVVKYARKPRSLGSMSAKDLANMNLSAQFGWLPLVKDVQDLMEFGHTVHKRAGELRKLYDRGWIGRTVKLDRGQASDKSSTPYYLAPSNAGVPNIHASWSRTTTVEKWGSSRWRLNVVPPYNPSDDEVFRQARRLASGLTPEGLVKGAWEVLPWTWLTDWFTRTGAFMQSYSNTVPASLVSCCVMRKTKTKYTFIRSDNVGSVFGGEGTVTRELRERRTGTPTLFNVSFPHISGNSLSILGSLFAQRFKI